MSVSWDIPSYAEANKQTWTDDMDGTDGVFALVKCGPVEKSPFFVTRKDEETGKDIPVYEKDSAGEYLLDQDGNFIPKIRYQTTWTWEVLSLDHPKSAQFEGQQFTQYYTPSMNTQSNMFEAVKYLFGGEVDPAWKPNPADLEGRVVKATIRLGKPNQKGNRWPKLDGYRTDRSGATYTPREVPTGEDFDDNDLPF